MSFSRGFRLRKYISTQVYKYTSMQGVRLITYVLVYLFTCLPYTCFQQLGKSVPSAFHRQAAPTDVSPVPASSPVIL